VITPCIGVCKITPGTQTCAGCFRSLTEISLWGVLTDSERLSIIHRINKEMCHAQKNEETQDGSCSVSSEQPIQAQGSQVQEDLHQKGKEE
jgi:predicted Fe-S protein YdhL (DUF1289 family)